MNKRAQKVYIEWVNGRSYGKSSDSIWTDGENVYSYRTCILAEIDPETFVLNRSQYSVTTTKQVNAFAELYQKYTVGIASVRTVTGLHFGVTPRQLINAAK